MSVCERCPSPGACAACPLLRRPQTGEFGKKVLAVNSLKEIPSQFRGIAIFNPVRQGGGEALIRLREKICSICQETASTCGHSKSKTSAVAAA